MQDDQWQFWDATNGNWWSTQRIECGAFVVEPGAGGPPFTTPATVAANCPGAQLILLGLSIGSGAPNLTVGADALHFQTTEGDFTFDFGPK